MRTGAYPQDARWRLADAVKRAREAAGYRSRPAFYKAAAIGKRSLENVESKEPDAASVGETVLHAIGRALPNWTEDTPRVILDGGPIPPTVHVRPDAEPGQRTVILDGDAFNDLNEILTAPRDHIVKISGLVEAVSGPAAAEKFLADAFAARASKEQASETQNIEPAPDIDRDPQ